MLRHCTKHDLYICKPEISVENDDPFPKLPELDRQIYGGVGLTNTSLATGDSDDTGQRS